MKTPNNHSSWSKKTGNNDQINWQQDRLWTFSSQKWNGNYILLQFTHLKSGGMSRKNLGPRFGAKCWQSEAKMLKFLEFLVVWNSFRQNVFIFSDIHSWNGNQTDKYYLYISVWVCTSPFESSVHLSFGITLNFQWKLQKALVIR